MYLDQIQWIQYVLYLNVSGLGADTEQIQCINTEIQCIVQLGLLHAPCAGLADFGVLV